jgi:electron transport complex protein RnfB
MSTIVLVLLVCALLASLVYWSATRLPPATGSDPLRQTADAIEGLLPQTQCGKCGYPGCRPYAEAIASGMADINQCPPGGETTRLAMAKVLRTGRPDR